MSETHPAGDLYGHLVLPSAGKTGQIKILTDDLYKKLGHIKVTLVMVKIMI